MIKQLYLFLIACLLSGNVVSQNEIDVARYFDHTPFGSARVSSMAGSFGALGGDLTMQSVNPAGASIYTKNEFSISPGFLIHNVESSAMGSMNKESETKLTLNNLGYVISNTAQDSRDAYVTFSLGYNKLADYNRSSSVDFINDRSSMLFSLAREAYGIETFNLSSELPFSSHLAYETYLIDPVQDTPIYYLSNPLYEESFESVRQGNRMTETGHQGEFYFNLAFAFQEKLYLGYSLSFLSGQYEQQSTFSEQTMVDSLLLDAFYFNYFQESELSAINSKLGIIFKAEDWVRFGLAYHLPYRLSVVDRFSTSMRSTWKDGEFFGYESPNGGIEYDIRYPGKWILSGALVDRNIGALNVDVELLNYSKSRYESVAFNFTPENDRIAARLANTVTVRVGGELWFGPLNVRLGYAFKQIPYNSISEYERSFNNTYSAGLGVISRNNIFFNLSVNYMEGSFTYFPYGADIAPMIQDKYTQINTMISGGVRF